MSEYLVEWVINVDASSPREAAEEAWQLMRKPDSEACVFTVREKEPVTGEYEDGKLIDLMDNQQ